MTLVYYGVPEITFQVALNKVSDLRLKIDFNINILGTTTESITVK